MSEFVALQKRNVIQLRDDNTNHLIADSKRSSTSGKEEELSLSVITEFPGVADENSPTLVISKWKKTDNKGSLVVKGKRKHESAASTNVFNVARSTERQRNNVKTSQNNSLCVAAECGPNVCQLPSSFLKSPGKGESVFSDGPRTSDSNWLISYTTAVGGTSGLYQSKFWNVLTNHNLLALKPTLGSSDSNSTCETSTVGGGAADNHGKSLTLKNKECGSLKPLPAQFKNDYPNLWNSCKSQGSKSISQDLNNFTWFTGPTSLPSLLSKAELNAPNLTAVVFPEEIPDLASNVTQMKTQQLEKKKRAWKSTQDIVLEGKDQKMPNSKEILYSVNAAADEDSTLFQCVNGQMSAKSLQLITDDKTCDILSTTLKNSKLLSAQLTAESEDKLWNSPRISNLGDCSADVPSDFYESIESLDSQRLNDSDVQDSPEHSVSSDSSIEVDIGNLLIEEKVTVGFHEDSEKSCSGTTSDDVYSPAANFPVTVPQVYSSSNTYPIMEEPPRGMTGVAYPWLRYSLFPHVPPTINFRIGNTPPLTIPPEIKKILKWKSTNVTPVIIRKVLYNSGMRIVKRSQQWISIWAKHMRANLFKTIFDYQKFNHFPGTFQIGRKDTLWRNHMRLRAVHGKKCYDFVPTTYIIPADMKQLRHAWEKSGSEQMWIVKPPAAARGSGIKVIHKFVQIPKVRPLVIQKYLSSPYLINGIKFDLRIYVYVTSFYPLRIYVYKEGLARFASVLYSAGTQTVSDRYMHLTNFSINRKNGTYTANEDIDACKGHKWSLKALWGYLKEQGHDTKVIWNSIVDLIIKTIISCENTVSTLTRLNMKNPSSCHELFGFDIILDSKLKPWLLEVNISPSLQSSSKLDVFIKGPMCKDLLNLSGLMIPPHLDKAYQLSFAEKVSSDAGCEITNLCYEKRLFRATLSLEERAKQAVFSRMERHEYLLTVLANPTPDDIRQLVLAEDERTRAGQYICVFPTHTTHRYHKFFDRARYYNHLFDAWEARYHSCRDDGIQKLIEACKHELHLRVVPRSSTVSSPRTDVALLSSSSSLSVKCCPRSTTNRAFWRAYRSARNLISRMRIRRSTSQLSTPTKMKRAVPSSAPTLSNTVSVEPQSRSSGMSSLAVHQSDLPSNEDATFPVAQHPFESDDFLSTYSSTWQSHHCDAFVKSKLYPSNNDWPVSHRHLDRVYPDVRNCFPPDSK